MNMESPAKGLEPGHGGREGKRMVLNSVQDHAANEREKEVSGASFPGKARGRMSRGQESRRMI